MMSRGMLWVSLVRVSLMVYIIVLMCMVVVVLMCRMIVFVFGRVSMVFSDMVSRIRLILVLFRSSWLWVVGMCEI